MSYEYQITIGSEEIYFEVEHDPEEMMSVYNEHDQYCECYWCTPPDAPYVD